MTDRISFEKLPITCIIVGVVLGY